MESVNKVLHWVILVLVGLLIYQSWVSKREQNRLYEKIQEGNKMILELDQLTKENNGQYTKLVNYFNSEKDLKEQLKKENNELYNLIKKQDEKLLMINNTIISLEGKMSEGFGNINEKDTNLIDLKLNYPNDDKSFITWGGFVNRTNGFYSGNWEFGELPLQIVLTETDRGMWRSRLIGPEWLTVTSMEINSLPLPQIETPSNFGLLVGGGYINSFDPNGVNGLSVGTGVRFKDHYLLINGTTNREIGFNYYHNIFNFKRK